MVKIRLLAVLTLVVLVSLGCSDSALKVDETRTVATVSVTPAVDTVLLGGNVTFGAVARNSGGDPIAGQTVTWAAINPGVATVAPSGIVTPVAPGATLITATVAGILGSGTIVVLDTVTVVGNVASVSIVPPSASISLGGNVQLVAVPRDSAGSVLPGLTTVWSASNSKVTVSSSGLVNGIAVGQDTVTATVSGVAGTSIITVSAVPVGSITVSPGNATLDAGGATLQLSATVKDAGGNTLIGIPLTWSSTNTASARVDSTGLVTTSLVPSSMVQNGVTISASADGKTGSATLQVVLRFRSISAANGTAGAHTCGITVIRVAYCWGLNSSGQMGIGTQTSWNGPIATIGSISFTAVATGSGHTCGVTTTGVAYCWGGNGSGQLGTGNNSIQFIPTLVSGSITFDTLSVTAGGNHTCALTPAGTAHCWGAGVPGQLGNGGNSDQNQPVTVSGGLSFDQISAGEAHTCGVTTGGQGYCWGSNVSGQLGTGNTTPSNVPVAVTGGHTYASISAGGQHSCGVTTSGAMLCWGDNAEGQGANGTLNTPNLAPTPIFGGQSWSHVSSSSVGSCGVIAGAQTSGASAFCWGLNNSAQIGNGDTVQVTRYTVPAAVQSPTALVSSRGDRHGCIVTTGFVAYCWGRNDSGQLGMGQFTLSTPFSIPLPQKVLGQP